MLQASCRPWSCYYTLHISCVRPTPTLAYLQSSVHMVQWAKVIVIIIMFVMTTDKSLSHKQYSSFQSNIVLYYCIFNLVIAHIARRQMHDSMHAIGLLPFDSCSLRNGWFRREDKVSCPSYGHFKFARFLLFLIPNLSDMYSPIWAYICIWKSIGLILKMQNGSGTVKYDNIWYLYMHPAFFFSSNLL